jgi:hypothetical protein
VKKAIGRLVLAVITSVIAGIAWELGCAIGEEITEKIETDAGLIEGLRDKAAARASEIQKTRAAADRSTI